MWIPSYSLVHGLDRTKSYHDSYTSYSRVENHRDDYIEVFAGEDRYNYILNGLHPPASTKSCAHLVDKWLTFPDMGHIVTVWSC